MQAGVVVEDLNVDDLLCIFLGLWKIFLLQELPVRFFSPFTLCTIFSRRHILTSNGGWCCAMHSRLHAGDCHVIPHEILGIREAFLVAVRGT